ncbi:MAG: divalent-cation tolerance protein CutA [Candidatus Woesearchaeota archaeon]
MAYTILYTTHPDQETAKRIAQQLLDRKLIACANLLQSTSIYTWQGEAKEEAETIALLKTSDETAEKAIDAVKELHPYDTPCITKLPVTANKDFEDWVENCTVPQTL